MKVWKEAAIVELNITETANGQWDHYYEAVQNDGGYNNDLATGIDSDGDGSPTSSTPNTIS